MFDLTNKTILITGSCRGIGLAMAQALHAQGASVAITSRYPERYPLIHQQFDSGPDRILIIECDVTCESSVRRAIDKVVSWKGELNGFIANAGERGSGEPVVDIPAGDWATNLSTNLFGTFHSLKLAAMQMQQQNKGGRIAVTASVAAQKGTAGFSDYAAGKAAIVSLCKTLAIELAPAQITANCILPGWVETEMNQDVIADRRQYESIRRLRIPVGKWAKAKDIAPVAVYLMSDESAYHTGDALTIDGGYSIF